MKYILFANHFDPSKKILYIFVGWILMLWHREAHINPRRNRKFIVDPAGIELTTSRLRQHRQLPVVQQVHFMPLKLCKKNHNPNDKPETALDKWQPIWNAQVSISPPVGVDFELHPVVGHISICWLNFEALRQSSIKYKVVIKHVIKVCYILQKVQIKHFYINGVCLLVISIFAQSWWIFFNYSISILFNLWAYNKFLSCFISLQLLFDLKKQIIKMFSESNQVKFR